MQGALGQAPGGHEKSPSLHMRQTKMEDRMAEGADGHEVPEIVVAMIAIPVMDLEISGAPGLRLGHQATALAHPLVALEGQEPHGLEGAVRLIVIRILLTEGPGLHGERELDHQV